MVTYVVTHGMIFQLVTYNNVVIFQLVTCVPTDKLPHMFSWGASTPQEIEMLDRVEEEPDSIEALPDDMGRRGQILWIRGLTRLQHQVGTPQYSHDYLSVVRVVGVVAFVTSHVIDDHGRELLMCASTATWWSYLAKRYVLQYELNICSSTFNGVV